MKRIYVDMDDVLCQTALHLLGIIERVFGKRISYGQLTVFDLGKACDLEAEQVELLLELAHQPDELLALEPVAGAVESLSQWAAVGCEIAVVTGRPPTAYESSLAWLQRKGIPHHKLLIVDKYGRFTGEDTVGISLEDFSRQRFSWAVEDSLAMATYLAAEMGIKVALFDRPWNQDEAPHPLIRRYATWEGLTEGVATGI